MSNENFKKPEILNPSAQICLRGLMQTFFEFERRLAKVPVIKKITDEKLSLFNYQTLLLNLRSQVMEGARWISRAASSFDRNHLEVRSVIIGHAREEHRDYQLLENDYLQSGGNQQKLENFPRNIGTEALHGFLMHRATQKNPIDLLGAMWIIEGLGNKMAMDWADRIDRQLNLEHRCTQFFRYHGENDPAHMDKFYFLLENLCDAEDNSDQIIKTAAVVGRLYCLQLEELIVQED